MVLMSALIVGCKNEGEGDDYYKYFKTDTIRVLSYKEYCCISY